MRLPNDAVMLLSVVNTKLRDCYNSLDTLCEDLDVEKELLENKLKGIGYEYNVDRNQFV